ncbi:IclR family transcriptional regulator C-terminal domain-containing protein [Curvibacter sp. HBC61]|uniref:IclR family transcriptional regulator C-terminal domain-containing protein n=1 Tax=Curvibacter cyanobacteriorum TaxID=3026422 RepID=A0ABT5N3B0_9BURK|nr:IclR family transcriptional regulator C-terminal domain-containing protein [Curvibacter sp. HBC61]MDD0840069.1 IclR family transcriptional regulator C-terminal domain-containing protein [Curvibacter sp. HBC61]
MEIDRQNIIEGLGKGLRVIEAFDDEFPRLTASEAAVRADLSRTAARRYLLSLVHFGYAETDGKRFWLAPRILRLGQSYLSAARLPRLVQPFIQRLANECGENFNFSVLDGHEVVYLARSQSNRMVSIGFSVGARVPAHVVTPGAAILSTWGAAELQTWVEQHEFSAFTATTPTDAESFLREVHAARDQGYWVAEQHLNTGLRGFAMPVKTRKGECVGAIGSTMTMQLSREEVVARLLPRVAEVVQTLRQVL